LRVNKTQQKELALGKMGVVITPESDEDYCLLNPDGLKRVKEIQPELVILQHPPLQPGESLDEMYSVKTEEMQDDQPS
jgi:uncharacterized protein YaiL (DUF2058 family)